MNPARTAKLIRRLAAPAMLIGVLALWYCFGSMRVAQGMDTLTGTTIGGRSMPPVPAGALCVIDKRKGTPAPGMAVFVELDDGSVLLSRVVDVTDDTVTVQNDNERSRLPDSDELGPLPRSSVRGTVLAVFPPDGPSGQ